jgi:hypothetical protein
MTTTADAHKRGAGGVQDREFGLWDGPARGED